MCEPYTSKHFGLVVNECTFAPKVKGLIPACFVDFLIKNTSSFFLF